MSISLHGRQQELRSSVTTGQTYQLLTIIRGHQRALLPETWGIKKSNGARNGNQFCAVGHLHYQWASAVNKLDYNALAVQEKAGRALG